jgi:hypothetical protein
MREYGRRVKVLAFRTIRRSVKAAPRILVPMVQVRILAAEQDKDHLDHDVATDTGRGCRTD